MTFVAAPSEFLVSFELNNGVHCTNRDATPDIVVERSDFSRGKP